MNNLVVALVASSMMCAAALAADGDATPAVDVAPAAVMPNAAPDVAPAPVVAPAPKPAAPEPPPPQLDDASFNAQFQCPETLADADARIDQYHRYVAWVRNAHPDWNFRKRLDVRYGLLKHHACAETLANIAMSGRPAFGP